MNQFKTVALLSILSALLITASYYIVGGTTGAIVGIGFAALMNLGSWYFSDQIALAAYRAQPVSADQAPQLHRIVQRLSDRANLPMPGVYLVDSPAANAFATGRDPQHAAIAVTQGLMQLLPPDELEAVIAHELSHVYNRDTLTQAVAATIAGAISFLANIATYSFWLPRNENDDVHPMAILLTSMLAPIAATIVQLGISRTREFEADAGAARLTQNPQAMIRALQRLEASAHQMPMTAASPAFSALLIVNPISGESLAKLFATHPSTEARIDRLQKLEQEMLQGNQPQMLA